jgi:O-succinylbenzoic acid--CoA ligase
MSALSVRAAAREAPDRVALLYGDRSWTWEEVAREVEAELEQLARYGPFDESNAGPPRVAFEATSEPRTVFLILALIEAGATAVPLRHGLTESEQRRQLDLIQSTEAPLDPTLGSDLLAILFTSGTGGQPRAIRLSCQAFTAAATASASRLDSGSGDRWLCCLPLGHVGGLSILVRSLIARGTVVLVPNFGAESVTSAIDRHGVTLVSLVPTMLSRILAERGDWRPPSSLRAVLLGGAPASEALWAEAVERGFPLRATYGTTETCSQVATGSAEAPRTLLPLDGVRVRVSDGQIEVAGPMLGEELGESTNRTADGYLRTGDLGRIGDDGSLEILGRADDVIVTGGENVSPFEVEAVLESHPAIARAGVFGHPDDEWGQVVAAALVLRGERPNSAELVDWCASRLASFKRPRRVALVDELPVTSMGKLDRRALPGATKGHLWPIA